MIVIRCIAIMFRTVCKLIVLHHFKKQHDIVFHIVLRLHARMSQKVFLQITVMCNGEIG